MQNRFFTIASIPFFLFAFQVVLMAQAKPVTYLEFTITIEKVKGGFQLESSSGSAWESFWFSVQKDQPQAIDEYGMTTLDKVSTQKRTDKADYLFTITETRKGIVLKGLEGTAWKELVVKSKKKKITINHLGMVGE
jgi:hypothetical protein